MGFFDFIARMLSGRRDPEEGVSAASPSMSRYEGERPAYGTLGGKSSREGLEDELEETSDVETEEEPEPLGFPRGIRKPLRGFFRGARRHHVFGQHTSEYLQPLKRGIESLPEATVHEEQRKILRSLRREIAGPGLSHATLKEKLDRQVALDLERLRGHYASRLKTLAREGADAAKLERVQRELTRHEKRVLDRFKPQYKGLRKLYGRLGGNRSDFHPPRLAR